jgi:hypothetical protein
MSLFSQIHSQVRFRKKASDNSTGATRSDPEKIPSVGSWAGG